MSADGTGLTNFTSRTGPDCFGNWVNCQLPVPTFGHEVSVTNVRPQRLNLREAPGIDQGAIGNLSDGDTACLLGTPQLEVEFTVVPESPESPSRDPVSYEVSVARTDGFQWWPLRTAEGWVAAFDPDGPDKPWLTASGPRRTRGGRGAPPRIPAAQRMASRTPAKSAPLGQCECAREPDTSSAPLARLRRF